ncbi:PfkB family carbohydrate kinase [uncultured Lactobacillus sp.]|uniref:PfkB family carbohydrate kinase n=1 Tax=uncultured Lactobacillus sp. TaxID=153152 RepID=UPI0025E639A2|nr:PfkB family carbohydrate kinase [uncultured Lactobacillus sp.]
MSKKHVVGLGDNVVDYYQNQNVKYPGGNAVNFSVFAPKQLVDSYYVGSLAKDDDGELILNSLKNENVNTSFCNRINAKTEKTFVNIVDGDRQFIDSIRGARQLPSLDEPDLMKILDSALVVYSACHANSEIAIAKLHQRGILIAYDFSEMAKYHTTEYLNQVAKNVDIAQFSLSEAKADDMERILTQCMRLNTVFVLFTNGGEPPLLFDCNQRKKYVGQVQYDPEPIDTMGAGDTFFANLVVYLLTKAKDLKNISEEDINESLTKAALAAAKTIRQKGSFGHGIKITK